MESTTNTIPAHLCLGYMAYRIDTERAVILETLYAVGSDGRVFKSDEAVKNNSFCGREWKKTDMHCNDVFGRVKTGGLEFIGSYPIPRV